ncbi:LysR family transcriptional regulator [Komagataeibacter nataicola]|uniref:LysR family transcriptional regulator n=1 Tax=Komagataeibacter nataicola TaxID=265960 RepID=UPI0023DD27E3|nr:LysR family transcriptional regulator [Komagataeibacter nataicola]WEQ55786.1 LysR family transcriptional regulator [Komagataeibacter nataicola]
MPLNDLLAFVEAARAGSMTQASIRLGRVQSSVSLRIKHLEEKLGVKLFERTSHGLELTAVGSAFLPRARDIISQWDAALLQINHVNGSAVVNVGDYVVRKHDQQNAIISICYWNFYEHGLLPSL